jgi:hypothetical protein
VVSVSTTCSVLATLLMPKPHPESLIAFYRKVRPIGAWKPVRTLCLDLLPAQDAKPILRGIGGGLATIYGILFAIGSYVLERGPGEIALWTAMAGIGGVLVTTSLFQLEGPPAEEPNVPPSVPDKGADNGGTDPEPRAT